MGHFVVKFDTYVKDDDNIIWAEHGTAVINLAQQGVMPQLWLEMIIRSS